MSRFRFRHPAVAVIAAVVVLLLTLWSARRHNAPPSPPAAGKTFDAEQQAMPADRVAAKSSATAMESEAARDLRLLANVTEIAAEFDRLRALPDDIERFRRSADLENEFAALLDADTAAFLVRLMPAGFVDSHFGVISLNKWAGADRAAAAAWMARHPGTTAVSAEALARGWLSADPSGLSAHLDRLPPGVWRDNLAVTAAEDAFLARKTDTVSAMLEHAAPNNARRRQLAEWNATAWARNDVEAAAAWASREPEPARRETLFAAVSIGQANTDPEAASARLVRTVTDPAALKPAVHAIVRIWAARDPSAAASWVAGLPDGLLRQEGEDSLLAMAAR